MSEVRFRPFSARDLDDFPVQARHEWITKYVRARPFTLLDAENSPWSFTMTVDGKPKACVGANDTGELWAFLAADLRPWMLSLTRYGRAMIDVHNAIDGPVWANIDPVHREGVKWAKLAGFRQIEPSLWVYP